METDNPVFQMKNNRSFIFKYISNFIFFILFIIGVFIILISNFIFFILFIIGIFIILILIVANIIKTLIIIFLDIIQKENGFI